MAGLKTPSQACCSECRKVYFQQYNRKTRGFREKRFKEDEVKRNLSQRFADEVWTYLGESCLVISAPGPALQSHIEEYSSLVKDDGVLVCCETTRSVFKQQAEHLQEAPPENTIIHVDSDIISTIKTLVLGNKKPVFLDLDLTWTLKVAERDGYLSQNLQMIAEQCDQIAICCTFCLRGDHTNPYVWFAALPKLFPNHEAVHLEYEKYARLMVSGLIILRR